MPGLGLGVLLISLILTKSLQNYPIWGSPSPESRVKHVPVPPWGPEFWRDLVSLKKGGSDILSLTIVGTLCPSPWLPYPLTPKLWCPRTHTGKSEVTRRQTKKNPKPVTCLALFGFTAYLGHAYPSPQYIWGKRCREVKRCPTVTCSP